MTVEELNVALYEKMQNAQEHYRDWLLTQEPAEILNHSYTYTVREDILMSLEYNDLGRAEAQALLRLDDPLTAVFHAFEKTETGYMDHLHECIQNVAKHEAEKTRAKKPSIREQLKKTAPSRNPKPPGRAIGQER